MKKDYRNIVIDDVKYQWLYNNKNQILSIFKIIEEYDLYSNFTIEKRRHIKTIYLLQQNKQKIIMTPYIVRHLMLGGSLDTKFIRKLKLKNIDDKK